MRSDVLYTPSLNQIKSHIIVKYRLCEQFGQIPSTSQVCDWIRRRSGIDLELKGGKKSLLKAMYSAMLLFWLRENGAYPPPERQARSGRTDRFYDSKAWLGLRYEVLKKHGAACQCCGATRADGVRIHVDHIKPRSKYPELELDPDNLQVLCSECNIGKLDRDETDWRDGALAHMRAICGGH